MSAITRRALVGVLGLVPLAVTAGTAAAWWDRLPSQLPTHWSGLGLPDGFSARGTTVAVVVVLAAVGGLLVVVAVWTPWCRRSAGTARFAVAGGGFLAGLAAGIWLSTAGATLAAGSAADAVLGWWVLLDVGGGAWASIALLLRAPAVRRHGGAPALGEDVPFRHVGPDERVGWSRVIGPTWLTWVTAGLLAVGVAITVAFPAAAPGAVIALVVTVLCARIEVTVDHRGLRVVAGLVRLPIKRIPLDRVERAEAQDVQAGDWGGWGYRVVPGRSALVLRSGPALVITQADGRRFAATLDDPATPAGLLNGLVAAR